MSFLRLSILFDSCQQSVHLVGLFPADAQVLSAHVSVCCQLTVDWTAQSQRIDDCGRAQVEYLFNRLFQLLICNSAGAEGVDVDGNRFCNADGISQLNLTFLCQFGCNDVRCSQTGKEM